MVFLALWLLIVPFLHFPYVPSLAHSLSHSPVISVLPLRSLAAHNPQSISLSLPCLISAFPDFSLPQASCWIVSCAMPPMRRPCLFPRLSCLYSVDDTVVGNASWICHICLPEVAKGSFSENWPLYLVLTLLLGEMLDVARYGPHGRKLRHLCQRLVGLINSNKAKSAFWPSLHWE